MSVPKWSFVFLQQNTKFYSCTQTAIHFFFLFFFYSEIQNSTVLLKRLFVFHSEKRNLELYAL